MSAEAASVLNAPSAAPGGHPVWQKVYKYISSPTFRDSAWVKKREELSQAIQDLNERLCLNYKDRDWRVDAAASILLGYDDSVIAATSDGKSFCYQLIALLARDKTVLVACPLLALMLTQIS